MASTYAFLTVAIVLCTLVIGEQMLCHSNLISQSGDIDFAYILELHEAQNRTCGVISSTEIQNAVAIDWAINKLNGNGNPNRSFIPGIQIGYKIYDDCGLESHAIKSLFDVWDVTGSCNMSLQTPLAGIIGTTVSHTTTKVAHLLSGSKLPMIGVSATTPELSNKTLYPNYIRTVPSDAVQSKVILDIVKHLKWTYIIGVHTDDNYGTVGFEQFRQYAEKSGVCIFRTYVIHRNDETLSESLTNFIRSLFIDLEKTQEGSVGGVYYGFNREAVLMYQTITKHRPTWVLNSDKVHNVHWVMSDGVGNSADLARELLPYRNMVITVSPSVEQSNDVQDNFASILKTVDKPNTQTKWSPWINEYIEQMYQCSPAGASNPKLTACSPDLDMMEKFSIYDYVTTVLDATYMMADVVNSVQKSMCSPQQQPCPSFLKRIKDGLLPTHKPGPLKYSDFEQELVPTSFYQNNRTLLLTASGDLMAKHSSLYDLNLASNGRFYKIGYYIDDILKLDEDLMNQLVHKIPRSACKRVCQECLKTPEVPFAYIPGDVIILGLFSLHMPSNKRFQCSDKYSPLGLHSLLSFLGAVEALKQKTGKKFGALAIDDCYNPLRTGLILNTVLSGSTLLRDPVTQEIIDVNKIVAAVGGESSTVTLAAILTLQDFGIPLISYGATSPVLDDRDTYPLFLRTLPSDTVQAKAMVELVQKLGVTHVAAVNLDNNYGRKGIGQFKKIAEERGICVENPFELSVGSDWVTRLNIIRQIVESSSKVVVYFGTASVISDLLDVIEAQEEPLIFIGSEAWGSNEAVLNNKRSIVMRGSFTFSVDVNVNIENVLKQHVLNLSPKNITYNPWLGHFWQSYFQCNIRGGFSNIYATECSSHLKLSLDDANKIITNDLPLRVVETVYSVGYGYVDAMKLPECSNPLSCNSLNPYTLLDRIKHVNLKYVTGKTRTFTDDGNGNAGFIINNIQKVSSNSYGYVQVGSYSAENGLQVNMENIKLYDALGRSNYKLMSSCEFISKCRVCSDRQTDVANNSSVSGTERDGSDVLFPVVVVLAVLCTIMMVFLAIVIFFLIRDKIVRKKEPLYESTRYNQQERYDQPEQNSYDNLNMQSMQRDSNVPALPSRASLSVPCCTGSNESYTPNTTDSSPTSTATTQSRKYNSQFRSPTGDYHKNSGQINNYEPSLTPSEINLPVNSSIVDAACERENSQHLNNIVRENDSSGELNHDYLHPVFERQKTDVHRPSQVLSLPNMQKSSTLEVHDDLTNRSYLELGFPTMLSNGSPVIEDMPAKQRSMSETGNVEFHLGLQGDVAPRMESNIAGETSPLDNAQDNECDIANTFA